MEFMIPIYRLLHFIGMAMLLGGLISSLVLSKKLEITRNTVKAAWNCLHLVAAPGLILLIITGLLHSAAIYWENFIGAGYMHAKITLVLAVLILLFIDMKKQKTLIKTNPPLEIILDALKLRQTLGVLIIILTLIIMWLVSYRPF